MAKDIVDLLWADQAGSRQRLSLDTIVVTAIALADAEGLAAVSMHRVGKELGFSAMALYRHLPGKAF
ncbi:TetR family transcriptional regulator [Nonomuraea angiospora]|uniref:TetR family transcriptional regulator n=1 Tax=Nonomuraea angiospora TaxID=46172 RepID=UPI00332CFCC2